LDRTSLDGEQAWWAGETVSPLITYLAVGRLPCV